MPAADSPGTHPPLPSDLLTREEAADYARLSVTRMDRARYAGELQYVRSAKNAGGRARVLIHASAIDAWLASNVMALFLVGLALHAVLGIPCPFADFLSDMGGG